jgi:hypothetical protein
MLTSAMSRLSKLIEEGMAGDKLKFPAPQYVVGQEAPAPIARPEPRLAQPGDSLFRLKRLSQVPSEFYDAVNRMKDFI